MALPVTLAGCRVWGTYSRSIDFEDTWFWILPNIALILLFSSKLHGFYQFLGQNLKNTLKFHGFARFFIPPQVTLFLSFIDLYWPKANVSQGLTVLWIAFWINKLIRFSTLFFTIKKLIEIIASALNVRAK